MDIVKLVPATKDYLWGGCRLKEAGKPIQGDVLAECWELSFHPDGPCRIASGPEIGKTLKEVATKEDIGERASRFPFFPVLIKLIDSAGNLSVQVHPSDAYALKNENSFGKTEMWHILHAEKGAGLYVGLKKETSIEEIREAVNNDTIMSLLNFYEVQPGESYFIPSGTIHAIGKGVTLIEIQQNSNLTYRLYDYHRLGKDGKPRQLHLEKALKVIDTHPYHPLSFPAPIIGECKYFVSERVSDLSIHPEPGSFISVTFVEGKGKLHGIPFTTLDTFFLPAGKEATIEADEPVTYIKTFVR